MNIKTIYTNRIFERYNDLKISGKTKETLTNNDLCIIFEWYTHSLRDLIKSRHELIHASKCNLPHLSEPRRGWVYVSKTLRRKKQKILLL